MFALICVILLLVSGASQENSVQCIDGFCISDSEIQAEAGLCVKLQCLLHNPKQSIGNSMIWLKCESFEDTCDKTYVIFNARDSSAVQPDFRGRVLPVNPRQVGTECSIVINDLTVSDSGSYQLQVIGKTFEVRPGVIKPLITKVSVQDLSQKPEIVIPPLVEGQQAVLTCIAPGRCSGAAPEITWMWRVPGKECSYIPRNTTTFKTQRLNPTAFIHKSTVSFRVYAALHSTQITCKVSFKNNISTEETATLNVNMAPRILHKSRCKINSRVLTCVCVSEGFPSPAITWPLLDLHTDYLVSSSVSQQTVSSSFTLPVSNYRSTVVECVSRNEAGEQRQNISVSMIEEYSQEGPVPEYKPGKHHAVLPWTIAALSLILNAICIICLVLLWKARKAAKPDQESETYMTLQNRDPSSVYDVIGRPVN